MNRRVFRITGVLLFGLLLGLPWVWRPARAVVPGGAMRLVVLTPHNEQIRDEIGRAFSQWHRSRFGRPVVIDWRAGSGTGDIERILLSGYEALLNDGRTDAGLGYDVLFGGGDFFFSKMKSGVGGRHSVLRPLSFSPGYLAEVYPTPQIADKPLYDPDGHWFGVVLSSFGIVYNPSVLADLKIQQEPVTWSDLADGRYFGRVALANPGHSGSVRVTYEAILQRYGWERGWHTLRRVCANARYFAVTSTRVPIDVSSGEAAAGMCIDFYGRSQAEMIGESRVKYVAPADATVVTADPVAVMRGTDKPELAERFVRFLLSREGQAVWSYKVGEPLGPTRSALRRPPVRRDMYGPDSLAHMADRVDMFAIARPLARDTPSYFTALPVVMRAAAIDIHDDLRAAWQAILLEKDETRRAAMTAQFDKLPFTQEELLKSVQAWREDPEAQHRDRLRWTAFFRENYRSIAANP